MKITSSLIAAAVAAAMAGGAMAGDSGKHGSFASYDANKDGRISRTEATTNEHLGKHFDKVDANRDGYLDQTEYDSKGEWKKDSHDKSTREGSQRSSDEAHSSVPGNLHPSDVNQPQTQQPAGVNRPSNKPQG